MSHIRPGTAANLDSRLRLHILPQFGDKPIGGIEPVDVREWVANLGAAGLSTSTVHATYGLLARILRTAEIDGVIRRTPCIGIALPRQTSHEEMHFLSAAQVAELAEAIDPRYRALIYTAAYTGLRWGELAGLKIDRVNLLRGTIDVREALTEVNGHVDIGPTKTGKQRVVSMPRFLCEMIGFHLGEFPSETFVFTSAEGEPLRRNFYRRHFKPTVARLDLPSALRFHDLRHTCASLLIAQGAHPKEIQERLGHSTIRLTFDRYGHLLPTLDDRLREGLEDVWNSARVADD